MSYTFSLSRRSLPVRCLCLLLIVLVLWCFFMVPRANAVLLEGAAAYYAAEVVIGVLATAGVVFASSDDAKSIASSVVGKLKDKTMSTLTAMFAAHSKLISTDIDMAKSAFRVSQDVLRDIIDVFKGSCSNGSFEDGVGYSIVIDCSTGFGFNDRDLLIDDFNKRHFTTVTFMGEAGLWRFRILKVKQQSSDEFSYSLEIDCSDGTHGVREEVAVGTTASLHFEVNPYSGAYVSIYAWKSDGVTLNSDGGSFRVKGTKSSTLTGLSAIPVTVPDGDLVYPSDDYLVRTPDLPQVDESTGVATWPVDVPYTKDAVAVPYPVDEAGEKVGTIPYDVPVDQTTGKDLTDTDNPSKPGEGTETGSNTSLLQKILDLLKNFFDSPSDFRLNMDGFRNLAIKDKFPFCIPFDMVDSVKQFAADAADYQFRVKLDTQYFKVDHVVDLTPLAVPLAFFRYLVVAWFAWVLMSRTHDLMKW